MPQLLWIFKETVLLISSIFFDNAASECDETPKNLYDFLASINCQIILRISNVYLLSVTDDCTITISEATTHKKTCCPRKAVWLCTQSEASRLNKSHKVALKCHYEIMALSLFSNICYGGKGKLNI